MLKVRKQKIKKLESRIRKMKETIARNKVETHILLKKEIIEQSKKRIHIPSLMVI